MAQEYVGRERIFDLFRETRRLTDGTYLSTLRWSLADDEHAVAVYRAQGRRLGRELDIDQVLADRARARRLAAHHRDPGRPARVRSVLGGDVKVGIQLPEVERVVRRDELAAMARAAEEHGFDSIWVGDHLLYRGERPERARAVGLLDDAGLARRDHRSRRARAARRVHGVPPTRDPGAASSGDRRAERRPVRDRARRGLEPGGVPCLRDPVRAPRLALRGGVHDRPAAAGRASASRSKAASTRSQDAVLLPPPDAAAEADDRRERAADALDRATARRRLEHVVHALRQHSRGVRPQERRDHGGRRARRARPDGDRAQRLRARRGGAGGRTAARRRRSAGRRGSRITCTRSARPGADEAILVLDPITESSIRTLRTALPSG